jgi:hypothetical protein
MTPPAQSFGPGAIAAGIATTDLGGPLVAVDPVATNPVPIAKDGDDEEDPPTESSPLLNSSASRPTSSSPSSLAPHALLPISLARFWTIIVVICLQVAFMAVDTTITSSSHPVISSYFGASHLASWLTTAFLLTNIAVNPVTVALADPLGRRLLMTLNGVVVALATTWCALAGTMTGLIFARALCGAGMAGGSIIGGLMMSDLISLKLVGGTKPSVCIVYIIYPL